MAEIKSTVSNKTKQQIDNLTKEWGMSTSTYLRLAVKQALITHRVPFQILSSFNINDIPVDSDETIRKRGLAFAKGDIGEKHHLFHA